MPHCIIEHSSELSSFATQQQMMAFAFRALKRSELFDDADIKVRAQEYSSSQRADPCEHFIHITTKIMNGRDIQQKQNLNQLIVDAFEGLFSPVKNLSGLEITVDVQEINTDTYIKLKL